MTLSTTPNKDAALALANRGLRVFPCAFDKRPKIAAWEENASASPFEIGLKWDASPDSIPGFPVGAHGMVVIDADRKLNGPDGVAAFERLCGEHGINLASSFAVATPSGGVHFYYRTEIPYSNSVGSLPDGIDVRGKGGYTVAPVRFCLMVAATRSYAAHGTTSRLSLTPWRDCYARNALRAHPRLPKA